MKKQNTDGIDIRNIIEITDDRIIYRDDRGDTAFIELEPCANSYEKKHNITRDNHQKYRCIGERYFGEHAYYELYNIGHVRLSMNLKANSVKRFVSKVFGWNFHAKDFKLFYSVQKQLNEHGWTTLDLS